MSPELQATESENTHHPPPAAGDSNDAGAEQQDEDEDEEEGSEEDEDDEPKLKYAKLTGSLTNIYRNGDSSSAFTVAGDKMAVGTHNGNIHVLSLPSLQSLKTYHAHSATITSLSISPVPPAPKPGLESSNSNVLSPLSIRSSQPANSRTAQSRPQPTAVPNTPNNAIYVATSSLDGHVCISSLLDPKDVQLRNFARPVQSVVLSPDYRNDRTYLSGGLAGQLILTVGGKAGITVDANTNSAAAAASGFLGSIGFGGDRGRDQVLHTGEGGISTIKWSQSGKWVVWVNEEGIKIMRSHLKLDSEASEDAWRRIAHAARPNRTGWQDMSGVWKARCEWIDERKIETDDEDTTLPAVNGAATNGTGSANGVSSAKPRSKKIERLVVGWGDTAWVLHIHEGGTGAGGKKQVGSADIVHKLQFRDCIVAGLTLYTPSMLAILAYRTRDDDDKPIQHTNTPRKGRAHRHTGLAPQLRLVNVSSGEEVDLDELSISRFETLSAQDYHLGTLYIPPAPASAARTAAEQRGALEGLWEVSGGKYASRMFSGSASVLSRSDSGKEENGKSSLASPPGSTRGVASIVGKKTFTDAHPFAAQSGLKLFIQSPYDCVLAVKRDLSDRLEWMLERRRYAQAWQLIDSHPEIVDSSTLEKASLSSEQLNSPSRGQGGQGGSLADFFADDSASQSTAGLRTQSSIAEGEKRRIGELWLQQLLSSDRWSEAGEVAGKVLGTSPRWEHWVLTFAQAERFDEITPHVPSASQAQLPGVVYEVILGHYISTDRHQLKQLLDLWDPALELYDAGSIVAAIESRLESDEVDEDTEDWRILMEALAKLYLADGRANEALRCWIRTQNADRAMQLIREEKLMDVIAAEDVPGLLMLRVSKEQMRSAPLSELEEATHEAMQLLVEEAHRGSVVPGTVIAQLQRKGGAFKPFIFFYLKALWHGTPKEESQPKRKFDRKVHEGHALVEDHADLAVELFAQYDRDLLMTFLRASEVYSYEKAAAICEQEHYIPELVYVLSKTGQTKRALWLIIGELGDVSQAIEFAKENPDLWDDLLDYSMNKPSFIRGLLSEVGTAIDPIQLVRRIPEGLEIEGLRDGIAKMMREYDIQFSISEGVARVLRGEVGMGMDTLRAGRKKGVRFDVVHETQTDVEVEVKDPPTIVEDGETVPVPITKAEKQEVNVRPGHCVICDDWFTEDEKVPLIGFACGHVYHLSCLLRANSDKSNEDTIERLLSQLGTGSVDEDAGYTGRSVGAKVAHAHIIKNVLKGGCPSCVVPEGA